MKKCRRIILRTNTLERIIFRQISSAGNQPASASETYKLEVRKTIAGKSEIIFEKEFSGCLEIKETPEEIILVFKKKTAPIPSP